LDVLLNIDVDGKLTTQLYDKRDNFNFASFTYNQFSNRGRLLTNKLIIQGFLQSRLMSAFCKFHSRCNDLIHNCKLSLSHICFLTFFIPIVRPHLAHWLWQRITLHSWLWNWAHGGCDWSSGDAYSS
jgi:hypothetical protein